MIRLSKQQILMLHQALIVESGGEPGLRDEALLESALNAPFQTFDEVDIFPTLHHKSARLGYGLIQNHPFVDGNKRIGTHAMLVFLSINGIELEYRQAELVDIIIRLASGAFTLQDLTAWIITKQK